MRVLLLFALLAAASAAQMYEPPVEDVMDENNGLGGVLEPSFDNATAVYGSLAFPFYPSPVLVNGSVAIAGMSPMIDNATYPADGASLLVARAARQGHLWSLPNPPAGDFICNYSTLYPDGSLDPTAAWRCDFDHDSCVEYESEAYVLYEGTASFTLGGLTSRTPFSSPVVRLPNRILEVMRNSSGAEQLNATVSGTIDFIYRINDPGTGDCGDNYFYATRNLSFVASRNFTALGTRKLFFLRAPVLREQWHRNNRFDVVVLSQSPLFHADVFLNGNRTRNITLRTFNMTAGAYGVQQIVSSLSAPDGWSEKKGVSTPTPLEAANNSFAYAYEFNYSYPGTGSNILALTVYDVGAGSANYGEQIVSRSLSYGGSTAEEGVPANATPSRPSFRPQQEYLSSMELVLGLLGVLFVLSLANSSLLK